MVGKALVGIPIFGVQKVAAILKTFQQVAAFFFTIFVQTKFIVEHVIKKRAVSCDNKLQPSVEKNGYTAKKGFFKVTFEFNRSSYTIKSAFDYDKGDGLGKDILRPENQDLFR